MTKNTHLVTDEDMKLQKEYILKLKALNDEFFAQKNRNRAVYTKTYGCQQNENDTERIRGIMEDAGFSFCDSDKAADVIIYNTCAVRENAEMKVFGRLGILKHIKEEHNPDMVIALCGCMVQQEHIAQRIKQKYRHVDLIFGTNALYKLPELMYKALLERKKVVDIESIDGMIAENLPIKREDKNKAWVSIMYGCNNFCSYCIVPYVRGRERSRSPEDILKEIRELADDGCTEICLLGQNVNSYGKDLDSDIDFSKLLRMVNDIDGIKRIRFMTSHPKDFNDNLINAMSECKKVCRQLHLPFQAGNNTVLRDMNRRYTKEEYLEKITKVKQAIPDIALSTDVIVGYPTETNEYFEDTLDILKKVEFDNIYSFIYSRREGTPAAKLENMLSKDAIQHNFNRLLEVQNEISKRKNEAYVGRTVEILVDGPSKTNPNMMSGRTDSAKIVNFPGGHELIGKYVNVKITGAHTWSLGGELDI